MDKTNINEAVDKHLLDLQESARRDDVYNQLNDIVDKLEEIVVYPALLWVWCFEIIRDKYDNHKEAQEYNDYVIAEGVTLKQIFDKFWVDTDNLGINMDHGSEIIDEVITDWMIENDFLIDLMVDDEL